MTEALALFCSDLHLTSQVPSCREAFGWLGAQESMLQVLIDTANKADVPLCIAGDIFHKPKEEPVVESLIIRMLNKLKRGCYAIPGQHDLPGHSIKRIQESSYNVLVQTGLVTHCPQYEPLKQQQAVLHSIPYGAEIPFPEYVYNNLILMAHQMVYTVEPFPGAPESGNVSAIYKKLKHYRMAVFGDNHQGFIHTKKDKIILNCGVAIQRTRAEIDYIPHCYLLLSDFTIKKMALPTTTKFVKKVDSKTDEQFNVFISTLREKQEVSLSFRENLKKMLEQIQADQDLQDMVWNIMEECNE